MGNNYDASACGPEKKARGSVAVEVIDLAEGLAGRAQSLAKEINEKLGPVMVGSKPHTGEQEPVKGEVSREYPPLFNCLRQSLQGIEVALDSIEGALSRTEL